MFESHVAKKKTAVSYTSLFERDNVVEIFT